MDLVPVELTVGAVLAYAAWDLVKDCRPSWPTPRQDPVVAVDRVHALHKVHALRKVDEADQVPMLVATRYRLRGRPDELRRAPDGRIVPVEIKSHASPRGGPLPSHRRQLLAYCLLAEEHFGLPPPYGILCYGDGTEFRVAWDERARAEVLAALGRLGGLYMAEADPSPEKCRECRYFGSCSVSAWTCVQRRRILGQFSSRIVRHPEGSSLSPHLLDT